MPILLLSQPGPHLPLASLSEIPPEITPEIPSKIPSEIPPGILSESTGAPPTNTRARDPAVDEPAAAAEAPDPKRLRAVHPGGCTPPLAHPRTPPGPAMAAPHPAAEQANGRGVARGAGGWQGARGGKVPGRGPAAVDDGRVGAGERRGLGTEAQFEPVMEWCMRQAVWHQLQLQLQVRGGLGGSGFFKVSGQFRGLGFCRVLGS